MWADGGICVIFFVVCYYLPAYSWVACIAACLLTFALAIFLKTPLTDDELCLKCKKSLGGSHILISALCVAVMMALSAIGLGESSGIYPLLLISVMVTETSVYYIMINRFTKAVHMKCMLADFAAIMIISVLSLFAIQYAWYPAVCFLLFCVIIVTQNSIRKELKKYLKSNDAAAENGI